METSHWKKWMAIWIFAGVFAGVLSYSETPQQYHIQTDEGPDRYFRFQTFNGQYRKEKRFDDGTVVGTYGWVDPLGLLRLYDYIADHLGYRIVRQRTMKVAPIVEPTPPPHQVFQRQPVASPQLNPRPHTVSVQSQPLPQSPLLTQPKTQQEFVTSTQPVTQPLSSNQLHPGTQLKPVSQSRPTPNRSTEREVPKLRPILVPLSQPASFSPPIVEAQPTLPPLPDPQLRPVTQSNLLSPLSSNSLQKDLIGNPVDSPEEITPTFSQSFGDKTSKVEPTPGDFGTTTNALASRRRNKGDPVASQRASSGDIQTTTFITTKNRGRGSIRFQAVPQVSAVNPSPSRLLRPFQKSQTEAGVFTTNRATAESPRIINSESGSRFRRLNNDKDSIVTTTSGSAGILTSQGKSTNSGDDIFDMPSDLPYSINYDLGNQFHFEKTLADGTKVGKHGYVDPLGILRVTHYSTGPNGHQQRQDNKWVGTRHPEDQK